MLGAPHVAAITDSGVPIVYAALERGNCGSCPTNALYICSNDALQPAALFPLSGIRGLAPTARLGQAASVSMNDAGQMVFDGPLTTGAFTGETFSSTEERGDHVRQVDEPGTRTVRGRSTRVGRNDFWSAPAA